MSDKVRIFTTRDIYGDIPQHLIDQRREICEVFQAYAKRNLSALSVPGYMERDMELVTKVNRSIDWNEKIINEEV